MILNLFLTALLVTNHQISKNLHSIGNAEKKVYYFHSLENRKVPQTKRLYSELTNYDTLFNDDGIPYWSFWCTESWWAQKFTPGVACTLKKVLIISTSTTPAQGQLYLWHDASGVPGQIFLGPISFQATSNPEWHEIDIPDTVISEDFWVGFVTAFPPDPRTDRRCDYPNRIASSSDGVNWWVHNIDDFCGDLMLRVICVLTGPRHDVAVWNINACPGPLLPLNENVTVTATVQNLGNVIEDSCPLSYTIYRGFPVYSDTTVISLLPYEIDTAIFGGTWNTTQIGEYRILAKNLLYGDIIQENNSKLCKCFVHTYPTVLYYDDGSFEGSFDALVDSIGRFAMEFTPPYYPCKIETLKLYLDENQSAIGLIIDDDGQNGEPGTILANGSVTATNEGWYNIVLSSQNVIINSGKFYAAYQNPLGDNCNFRGDENDPLTGLDWIYLDYCWLPREQQVEYGVRVCVGFPAGISEEGLSKNHKCEFEIYPNPARSYFTIRLPQTLLFAQGDNYVVKMFAVSGKVVKEARIKKQEARISLEGISPGIYFIQIDNEPALKKIVITKQ